MMQKTKLQKKYTLRTKLKTSFEKKVSSFFFATHRRKILIMSQVMFDKRFERLQQKGIICHFFLLWFVLRLEKKNYSFTTICIQLNNNSIITIQLFQMMGLLSGKISLSALGLEIMDPYLFFGLSEL